MRKLLFALSALIFFNHAFAQEEIKNPNEIIIFLEGKWHNFSTFVANGNPVISEDYRETMVIKNDTTLSITAHGYLDGKDLTKDMILILEGDKIIMKQGGFIATGKNEGNVYYLKGNHEDTEYRFRLYTMGDKYIFHNEVWKNGIVHEINMSYLLRQNME